MKRNLAGCCALVCALATAPAALARPNATAAAPRIVTQGWVTGRISAVTGDSFTIRTAGSRTGLVNALAAAATRVTRQDYPYVYGGGHQSAGTASVGLPGPGYNGHRIGYDCSGSVAAVLVAGGLWPTGAGVPSEAGMISELTAQGLIAPGPGRGPVEVTLYDDPGVHLFMNIDGRYFGTSDGGGGGDPRGGAGWLDDGAPDSWSSAYNLYHFVPSVLNGRGSSGYAVTFQGSPGAHRFGQIVHVHFQEQANGSLVPSRIW